MPHVITQSCCSDGSCVYACPVNCIHPSPDEPGFATAEMLYIDPVACVDCGACVSACPVGAIAPDSKLTDKQLPFIELNAGFYPERPAGVKLPPTSKLAPVLPAPQLRRGGTDLTVAVVGSGPAGMYAADELLTQKGVRVNVFDKLPTPFGLVRAGVAPDHQHTKGVTRLFEKMSKHPRFTFYLNVEVGQHVSHAELLQHHHAVLYTVGAPHDRRLDIAGMELPGAGTATETVAWINGHPDFAELPVDLRHERVVVIGNGNVALDVARILTADPDDLARTDISDAALSALRGSAVREVVIAARRRPVDSAFTLPELIGLTSTADVVLDAADHALVQEDLATATDAVTIAKLEILAKLPVASERIDRRRIRLVYRLTPHRVLGTERVACVEFRCTGTEDPVHIEAGLLLTSIGYRVAPIAGLPFDESAAVVPNRDGRVIDPVTGEPIAGAYVAGWIKRGPTGFIGTNKSCSMQTVSNLVDDFNAGLLGDPDARSALLDKLVRSRQPDVVDARGWRAIDAAETARGEAQGRARVKFTEVSEMVAVAARAPEPPLARRLLAGLLR
ncbi:FAD-dependent oxidoreductase [Mycolicibacterium aichiense]|uniref:ferredoxin--NADP(+) reductase n=1 Tax=Mycolicibacterium aichiense TaxID=1799 RepID=A0AAD1HKZ5_9MYCO|nr:FAD-dependent oxidoreductase [Mycolicibacterium aichiense]MCV7021456.1 FAD-dependent oxidoreductase [Mycolicibacterium aichiense]BBX06038.1 ferredoxin [Mycolicibacterium aichiense]STZ24623.1 ferredoxin/ferredoxin--NADP reductase [Mycolicibacterium aichiense]